MRRFLIATFALAAGVFGLITAVGWVVAEQPTVVAEITPTDPAETGKGQLPARPAATSSNQPAVSDPTDAVLDREAKQLALRVRAAMEPEKSKLRAELEQLTERHFEQRQQRRKQEIDELADRVDKLRVAHHRRQESKPDIIKRRLADLLGENDWNEEAAPNAIAQRPLVDGVFWFRAPSSRSTADARMEPIVARLLTEGHSIETIQVDDHNSAAITSKYQITSVPTFVIVHDGRVARRFEGATTYEALKRWLLDSTPLLKSPSLKGDPKTGGPATDPAPAEVNALLWSRLGLKLAQLEPDESRKLAPKYQGGMRVTEVAPNRSAKAEGIRPGDTLVGLHVWETTSLDNIAYIFSHPDLRTAKTVKFYAVRGSETLFGFLRWTDTREIAGQIRVNDDAPMLDGEWLVTLPAGFEFVGTIAQQEDGTFKFTDMRNLSGTFRFSKTNSDTLERVLDPKDDPRDQYEWLILNEKVLVLTKSPQHIGADYRGATLRRGAKPKSSPTLEPAAPPESERRSSKAESSLNYSLSFRLRQAEARRRVAEAELKVAKNELDQMEAANKKVPGAVSVPELERARLAVTKATASFDTADAELKAHIELSTDYPVGSEPREKRSIAAATDEVVSFNTPEVTTLMRAAWAGDEATIGELLGAEGRDVNARTADKRADGVVIGGWTALLVAVREGHVGATRQLLRAGADPNIATANRRTCLGEAILQSDTATRLHLVRLLLAAGAKVNEPTSKTDRPLHLAAMQGCVDTVTMLIVFKTPLNTPREADQATPLMVAAQNGRTEVVQHLLNLGANDRLLNASNQSALDLARKAGHDKIVELLDLPQPSK